MNAANAVAAGCGLAIFLAFDSASGQYTPPVRRAQPVQEPPIMRAQPVDDLNEAPPPRPPVEQAPEAAKSETEAADRRQIEYANALFTRKLYDLAIPEYQKYLDDYPSGSGRANAYFSLGECYRNLNRPSNARSSFQKVLNDYPESEFAGPAAYALGEMAFSQKDYSSALPVSPLGREIEGAGGCIVGALFRSALPRSARAQRRSLRHLSAGRRRNAAQPISRRRKADSGVDCFRARTKG